MRPREILGVAPNDGIEKVRRAYRRAVLECHPDRNASPEAASRFAAVTDAYRAIVRGEEEAGRPPVEPTAPRAPDGPPPILSWRNVESNLHFCLRGLGRLVRKAIVPGNERPPRR